MNFEEQYKYGNNVIADTHLQTITTKYLCPTNCRGARIKATASMGAGSITVPYDSGSSEGFCHAIAATALMDKLGWQGNWVSGASENGHGYTYVCIELTGQNVNVKG